MNKLSKINDTVYLLWIKEGKTYISRDKPVFEFVNEIELLYDFNLEFGDSFTLPFGLGIANVIHTDSIKLITGNIRKRLILKHRDPLNDLKYGDLIWIEGVGSPSGVLYYSEWLTGEKYKIKCFYDRKQKRYTASEDSECLSTTLSKPKFDNFGPFWQDDQLFQLPTQSRNIPPVFGSWSPSFVKTDKPGIFHFLFTPDSGQYSDTAIIQIVVEERIQPSFDATGPYIVGSNPPALSDISLKGIRGKWNPSTILTDQLGEFLYTFTPNSGKCAIGSSITIQVLDYALKTDMENDAV